MRSMYDTQYTDKPSGTVGSFRDCGSCPSDDGGALLVDTNGGRTYLWSDVSATPSALVTSQDAAESSGLVHSAFLGGKRFAVAHPNGTVEVRDAGSSEPIVSRRIETDN